MKNTVICIFGSSIMEGIIEMNDPKERWYEILRASLRDKFPDTCFSIINSAIGGQSTRECMERFDCDVLSHNPDYLIVMCAGNNDDYARPERIVSHEEFEELNENMLSRLPAKTKVIAVGLGPIINELHWTYTHPLFMEIFKKLGKGLDESIEWERESFRQFAKSRNLPFYDLYRAFEKEPQKYLLPDGVHLNTTGNKVFGESIFNMMKDIVEEK